MNIIPFNILELFDQIRNQLELMAFITINTFETRRTYFEHFNFLNQQSIFSREAPSQGRTVAPQFLLRHAEVPFLNSAANADTPTRPAGI